MAATGLGMNAVAAFKKTLKKLPTVSGDTEKNEFTQLQASMETKIKEMENSEKKSSNNRIVEDVMEELEQRNLEISSLLTSSEKKRSELEEMIRERNKEITNLRANTLVMYSLDDSASGLEVNIDELQNKLSNMEEDWKSSKQQVKSLQQRIKELNRVEKQASVDFDEKTLNLTKKLNWAEEQDIEQTSLIEKAEATLKELFHTCEKLGDDNNNVKTELQSCILSGNNMKDTNNDLQYCKEYLEDQMDRVVKDLKHTRAQNEKMKLEFADASADSQNHVKQLELAKQKVQNEKEERSTLKDQIKQANNKLGDFESGIIKSAVDQNEIKKEKQIKEATLGALEGKVAQYEDEVDDIEDNIKVANNFQKRMDSKMIDMETKISHFQENFIENHEVERIKKELQVRHKLDMNTQRTRISAILQHDHKNVIKTIQDSLSLKEGGIVVDGLPDLQFSFFNV